MTDSALIRKYVEEGSSKSFECFYKKHKNRLYGFICSRTYSEYADDIFQESFRKFIDAVFSKTIKDPKNYLYTIAVNLIKDRGKNRMRNQAEYNDKWRPGDKNPVPSDITEFEIEFDKEPELDKLKKALNMLSEKKPEFHSVLYLHVYSGFTFDDIAVIEDLNRNTASARYMYAIKYLKRYYGDLNENK